MGPKGDPKATLGTWCDPTGVHGDPKGTQGVIFTNFWAILGAKKGPKTGQKSCDFSMFFWMHFGDDFDCFLGPFWYPFGVVFGPRRSKHRKGAMSILFVTPYDFLSFWVPRVAQISLKWEKSHLNNYEKSESILGALLVHFSSQNGVQMHQKSDQNSIEKYIGKNSSRNHWESAKERSRNDQGTIRERSRSILPWTMLPEKAV